MCESKIQLKFGVGKVLVGVLHNSLLFEVIKDSADIGSKMSFETEVLEKYNLLFYSLNDVDILQSMLADVYDGVEIVKYKNFIFDFTTYNINSVNIFYEALSNVKLNLLQLIAV